MLEHHVGTPCWNTKVSRWREAGGGEGLHVCMMAVCLKYIGYMHDVCIQYTGLHEFGEAPLEIYVARNVSTTNT